MLQYAIGVLHIVTLVPVSRKMIVNATLSNNRTGIAVILDAANSASSLVDPEVGMCGDIAMLLLLFFFLFLQIMLVLTWAIFVMSCLCI